MAGTPVGLIPSPSDRRSKTRFTGQASPGGNTICGRIVRHPPESADPGSGRRLLVRIAILVITVAAGLWWWPGLAAADASPVGVDDMAESPAGAVAAAVEPERPGTPAQTTESRNSLEAVPVLHVIREDTGAALARAVVLGSSGETPVPKIVRLGMTDHEGRLALGASSYRDVVVFMLGYSLHRRPWPQGRTVVAMRHRPSISCTIRGVGEREARAYRLGVRVRAPSDALRELVSAQAGSLDRSTWPVSRLDHVEIAAPSYDPCTVELVAWPRCPTAKPRVASVAVPRLSANQCVELRFDPELQLDEVAVTLDFQVLGLDARGLRFHVSGPLPAASGPPEAHEPTELTLDADSANSVRQEKRLPFGFYDCAVSVPNVGRFPLHRFEVSGPTRVVVHRSLPLVTGEIEVPLERKFATRELIVRLTDGERVLVRRVLRPSNTNEPMRCTYAVPRGSVAWAFVEASPAGWRTLPQRVPTERSGARVVATHWMLKSSVMFLTGTTAKLDRPHWIEVECLVTGLIRRTRASEGPAFSVDQLYHGEHRARVVWEGGAAEWLRFRLPRSNHTMWLPN